MAGGDDHFRLTLLDLPGLYAAVEDPLRGIGHGPGAAASTTAVVAVAVRLHIDKGGTAGSCDNSAFLEITVAKGFQRFAAIVARVVVGSEFGMDGVVKGDAVFPHIFEQKIKYGINFYFLEYFRKPFVQPEPGCIICVASFG